MSSSISCIILLSTFVLGAGDAVRLSLLFERNKGKQVTGLAKASVFQATGIIGSRQQSQERETEAWRQGGG